MTFLRREFLKRAAASAAAATAAGRVIECAADDKPQSSSPGEKLGVAVVGTGGRGSSHIDAYSGRKDTEILYLVDCDKNQAGGKQKKVGERQGRDPQIEQDYRKMLEDPAVDVVTIATPNHWHSLIGIHAVQAGKHVYVEKPVSHNVWEGRQLVEWSRKTDTLVQCGTQSRSSPSLHEAHKFIHEGNLGPIKYVVGTCYKPRKSIGKLDKPLQIPDHIDYDLWCGPAAMVDLYRPKLHYDWHWDWNTGNGDMGNQGIHQMDIARWFLNEDKLSPKIISIGGRLGYEDGGNTPNTQTVLHAYEKAPLIFETRGLPESKAAQNAGWKPMDDYRGSQIGVLVFCEKGLLVIPSYSSATAFTYDGEQIQKWSGGGDHFGNLIDAIHEGNRELLKGEILEGHLSSALCHTGGISHVLGRPATAKEVASELSGHDLIAESFDRMAEHLRKNEVNIDAEPVLSLGPWVDMDGVAETIIGNDAASRLLTRDYRDGYVVPDASA
ncbi:MAG: Gfo/Idh/MocA family oxidoreductase [Planctomycetaceae bacterium]